MTSEIQFAENRSLATHIEDHLRRCELDFVPPLGNRTDIAAYAAKLASRATRFEAWHRGDLVGLVAAYCNDTAGRVAFITSVSVQADLARMGVATTLITGCLEFCRRAGMREIRLEVAEANSVALRFYEKLGFQDGEPNGTFKMMSLQLQA